MQIAKPIQFLFWSVLCQAIGFAAALLSGEFSSSYTLQIISHAAAALWCAHLLKLSRPWLLFNLSLPILLALSTALIVPERLLLLGLVLLLLIYIPTFWTRVPFYPTSLPMYEVVLEQLPEDSSFTFVDLGCGFGSLLTYLARRRPKGSFFGVEIGPLPYLVAKLRSLLTATANLHVGYRNFWNMDFSQYDYVYAFLAPGPMPEIWRKCSKEMKSGSTLLVNSFPVPAAHDVEIHVEDRRMTVLYVYRRLAK